jgi:D-xylose transport system substrate-binding protein
MRPNQNAKARHGVAVLATLLLFLGPTACKPPQHTGVLIGFSMDTLKEEHWQRDKALFVAHAEAKGAHAIVQAASGDDAKQLDQAENMLTQGVDVLVVVPHNADTCARIVTAAHLQGVKVLSYDRLIRNAPVDHLVAVDCVKVGEIQGQFALSRVPKGTYLLIGGAPSDNNALLFRKGQMNVLTPAIQRGDIKIAGDPFSNDWLPSEAMRHTENALTVAKNHIDAVVASNDGTAGGAIKALEAQKMAGKVLVTGLDAELAACQRVVAGTQSMTIYKPVKRTAETAVDLAIAMAKGETVPHDDMIDNGFGKIPATLITPVAVDKHNMDSVIVSEGYHSHAAIYERMGGAPPAKP